MGKISSNFFYSHVFWMFLIVEVNVIQNIINIAFFSTTTHVLKPNGTSNLIAEKEILMGSKKRLTFIRNLR